MSKKDNHNSNNGASLTEISTIRDILMGQHIDDFESKFKSLQDQLAKVESKLTKKINDLSTDSSARQKELNNELVTRFSQLESSTDSRFGQIEQSLKDGLADLQNMMDEASMNDKERIGKLLMEAGKDLLKS